MAIRKIIHIDMDAFYASVELLEHPELRESPLVIASHHPRSVIAAASYPARQYGLRSAMPMSQARKLCPHVVVIEPHFDKYRAISAQLHQIFQQYTKIIEPLSLDEAYLDVTQNLKNLSSATEVAMHIRHDIFQKTRLTASAGVAPNKFLAKIASDWNKPDGLCVIKPNQVMAFIEELPLKKIPGVGRVTEEKLNQLQLKTLGDLQSVDENFLIHHFGKYGKQLFLYAQGIDHRPVESQRERQQISKETTFDQDLYLNESLEYIKPLAERIWHTLQQKKLFAYGVSIKLKRNNFKVLQHSKSFKHEIHSIDELIDIVKLLSIEMNLPENFQYRLIGLGVYQLKEETNDTQLNLWLN